MQQIKNKIIAAVDRLQLNLQGKVVLTEAATGAYIVTPVIAALAGAEVYAYTKTTKYGTVEEVQKMTNELLAQFTDKKLSVTIIDTITPEVLAKADIITNAGHLRPLNNDKLKHTKKGVVIPLMYEAWEWRDADLDVAYCKKNNIVVGATNERHPDVDVFNYLGDMAIKMIFDADLCPYKNKFVLICNNDFGPFMAKVIARNCNGLAVIDKNDNKEKYADIQGVEWIGGFPEIHIPNSYYNAEAVIFTAYPFVQSWIGNDSSAIPAQLIKQQMANPLLLRYAGHMDTAVLNKLGIRYYPEEVKPGHMGILPSAIGYDPIINLQAGGLKVGEALLTGNYLHKNIPIAELL